MVREYVLETVNDFPILKAVVVLMFILLIALGLYSIGYIIGEFVMDVVGIDIVMSLL